MKEIKGFFGPYRWLSNFWSVDISYMGLIYPTVEHAYQATKAIRREDRLSIQQAKTPGEAKRIGRRFPRRLDSLEIMRRLTEIKYENQDLRKRLLATGDAYIEETNTWGDQFWGVCRGRGDNHLGEIIMAVRDAIR